MSRRRVRKCRRNRCCAVCGKDDGHVVVVWCQWHDRFGVVHVGCEAAWDCGGGHAKAVG